MGVMVQKLHVFMAHGVEIYFIALKHYHV